MSDLGNLSNCVMDSDPGASGWTKRLRRKAFAASVVLEGGLVGAMLLWPLISPAVLPVRAAVTPVPPYRAERPPTVTPASSRESANPASTITPILSHPTVGPHPIVPGPPEEPSGYVSLGAGGPEISIPGGNSNGRPIEVPRPAPPNRPVNMSAGVMAALLVRRVEPEYPKLAEVMHLSGTVELQARIGTDGTVRELEVISGNPILARAAVEAVQQWRYQPTRLDGQPVEVETHITVTFTLD